MGQFLSQLRCELTDLRWGGDREVWVLLDDLIYQYGGPNDRVIAPKGFLTDFCSVPRAFWWFIDAGTGRKAGAIHDRTYRERLMPRDMCDAIFRSALRDCGVEIARRYAMWLAVRLCGKEAYKGPRNAF